MWLRIALTIMTVALAAGSVRGQALPGPSMGRLGAGEVFRVPPMTILKRTLTLARGSVAPLSAAEMDLLEDSKSGSPTRWKMAGAALLIAGAKTKDDQARYGRQLEEIEAGARAATVDAKSAVAKAKELLHYLHGGPMRGGYVSGQSNLLVLLDTGKFNCVSSAVLYNLLAKRLGLDVKAVEIPNHVFSILRVGEQVVDIEPTNPHGIHDPLHRQERIRRHLHQDDGDAEDIFGPELYRDTNNLGLLAMMYANQSSSLARSKRYAEAAIVCLKSLCMDPNSGREVIKLQHNYERWYRATLRNRDYRQALAIAQQYRQLLRAPGTAEQMVRESQQALARWQRTHRLRRAVGSA